MSMRLKFIPPYSHSVQLTKRWDHPATAGTPFSSRPPKLTVAICLGNIFAQQQHLLGFPTKAPIGALSVESNEYQPRVDSNLPRSAKKLLSFFFGGRLAAKRSCSISNSLVGTYCLPSTVAATLMGRRHLKTRQFLGLQQYLGKAPATIAARGLVVPLQPGSHKPKNVNGKHRWQLK